MDDDATIESLARAMYAVLNEASLTVRGRANFWVTEHGIPVDVPTFDSLTGRNRQWFLEAARLLHKRMMR